MIYKHLAESNYLLLEYIPTCKITVEGMTIGLESKQDWGPDFDLDSFFPTD